jgi:hypothetical protein
MQAVLLKILSQFRGVVIEGAWIGELDLLTCMYTPLGTTSNYSGIAHILTSKITESAKPFPSCCVFQQPLSSNDF